MSLKKPLRIWSCDRIKRHGIVAESFDDALQKGAKILGIEYTSSLEFVLEEDGTKVDSEFWKSLQSHTRLILLKPGELWCAQPIPILRPPHLGDSVDGGDDVVDIDGETKTVNLLLELHKNPAVVVLMNMKDLEILKDADIDKLDLKSISKDVAKQIQEICTDVYVKRRTDNDALEYINLLKRSDT